MMVVEVFVDSGKAQNENEAKRLREFIPSAIDRGFPDRRGPLLLVSASAIGTRCWFKVRPISFST